MARKILAALILLVAGLALLLVLRQPVDAALPANLVLLSRLTRFLLPLMLLSLGFALLRRPLDTAVAYAPFWKRGLATLIDGLIVSLPVMALQQGLAHSLPALFAAQAACTIGIALLWLYLVVRFGATPGKMLLRIRIADEDTHSNPSPSQALRRAGVDIAFMLLTLAGTAGTYFALAPDALAGLGFTERGVALLSAYPLWVVVATGLQSYWTWSELVVMLFNDKRKALHDYLGGTVVLEGRSPVPSDDSPV